jgi:hypothetical protein
MKSEIESSPLIDPETEARRILEICDGRILEAINVLERQFGILHTRAQVLFSFCGIVITVTGFSGRLIAGTNVYAQGLVVSGLAVVILCALYIYHSVMTLRWITQRMNPPGEDNLARLIERRNKKTNAYRRGGYILFLGIMFYGIAVAIMLLNPVALDVPVR